MVDTLYARRCEPQTYLIDSVVVRLMLLSGYMDPGSGWGNITYGMCQGLLRHPDVYFELHIPRDISVTGDIPFRKHIRQTLPPWVASFHSRPYKVVPFVLPVIRPKQFNVVHTLIEFPYCVLANRLSAREHIPLIISTQGTYTAAPMRHWPNRLVCKGPFRRATVVTAPSHFTADAIRKSNGICREIRLIHNPVEYERFQETQDLLALRNRIGLPLHARIVLGVGGLKRRKGFDVLVRAIARVVSEVPQVLLVIAGTGPEQKALESLARSLGIREHVRFVGQVMGEDLVGLYQTCEVYSHLPRNEHDHFEGFGIVYLEAAACGKPIVATRSGGVAEAVLDGRTGILVDEDDHEAATEAILRLLHYPALARSLGEEGRKYAAKHSWEWYVEEFVHLYKELAEVRGLA